MKENGFSESFADKVAIALTQDESVQVLLVESGDILCGPSALRWVAQAPSLILMNRDPVQGGSGEPK